MKKDSSNPTHYVNNKELYNVLIEYNNLRLRVDNPRIPEYVGMCIKLIAEKLASRGNFVNYSYKDEMISDAIENCLNAVDNFNTEKYNNPHAYFTQIAWFAFLRRIDREKKQHYLKYKNYRKYLAEEQLSNDHVPYTSSISATDEIVDEYIKNYEEAVEKKKKKTAKKKGLGKFMES